MRPADLNRYLDDALSSAGLQLDEVPLGAPNEFGLVNESRTWDFMLLLSDASDDLQTPGMFADENAIMQWLKALLKIHFGPARAALLAKATRGHRPAS